MAERRRATVDESWMGVAKTVALRSRCVRSQVGCVIVDRQGRVVATGYNGPAANWDPTHLIETDHGLPDAMMCDSFCPRGIDGGFSTGESYGGCVAIHAEANALLTSDRRHREGGTIYTSRVPCLGCAKLICNSGVERVVCGPAPEGYPQEVYDEIQQGVIIMKQCLIAVRQLP
jgi:dCMP deaminase